MQTVSLKILTLMLFCALGAFAQDNVPAPEIQPETPPAQNETPPPAAEEPPPPAVPESVEAKKEMAPAANPSEAQVPVSDPDFKREERFHNVYKTYNERPTSAEEWEKALSQRKAEAYTIQKNDTLWDLSKTLFGDPYYWPKVWSINSDDIMNPHEISPDKTLKFYPGTVAEAPTVGVAKKDEPPEALPDEVIEKDAGGKVEAVKIPPPTHKSRPVIKHLPDSLPLYRIGAVNHPPGEIDTANFKRDIPPPQKYLATYVVDSDIPEEGEVVEVEGAGNSAGDFQYIVVRVKDAGKKNFFAVKDTRKVSDPFVMLSSSAKVIDVQGNIEVLTKVNDNLYRAIVLNAISPVEVGSKLLPGSMEMFDTVQTPVNNTTQARIIGGLYQRANENIYGDDDFVFLNAGSKEGLQAGSSTEVFLNERLRNPKSLSVDNDRKIGVVKIIKVAEHFATGYVEKAEHDIILGDYVGGSGGGGSSGGEAKGASAKGSGSKDDLDLEGGTSSEPPAPAAQPQEGTPTDEDLQL